MEERGFIIHLRRTILGTFRSDVLSGEIIYVYFVEPHTQCAGQGPDSG